MSVRSIEVVDIATNIASDNVGTTSELPLIGITNYQDYQPSELPTRLIGIPN